MNEETLLRAAKETPWPVPLPPAAVVRARAQSRRLRRRIGVTGAVTACAVGAVAFLPGVLRGDSGDATDPSGETLRVGPVVLDQIPRGWSLTANQGSELAADACLGPDPGTCDVRVIAARVPAADSGIPWFSVLTESCVSNKSTQVLTETTQVPAGPAQLQTLECAGLDGTIRNVAWVLDAGVAVIPASSAEADHAREVVEGLRFAAGPPTLAPVASEEPSRQVDASP